MSYKNSRRNRPRPNYARGIATAARMGFRAYRSYTKTNTKRGSSGVGVTSQHDAKTIYRKKRMPRRKRKAWGKFSKKVHAVLDKSTGTKTHLKNNVDALSAATGSQVFATYNMYGMNGADLLGSRGNADLVAIFSNYINADKLILKSAVLDITIENTNSVEPIEVDIYHVRYNNEHEANTPLATFINGASNAVVPSGKTAVSILDRGASPFDIPLALSIGRITIVKKTKVFLGVRNSTTYQIRDPRNRMVTKYDINNQTTGYNYVKPGMTQGIILIAKNTPGGAGATTFMSVGCTTKYSYGILESAPVETGKV